MYGLLIWRYLFQISLSNKVPPAACPCLGTQSVLQSTVNCETVCINTPTISTLALPSPTLPSFTPFHFHTPTPTILPFPIYISPAIVHSDPPISTTPRSSHAHAFPITHPHVPIIAKLKTVDLYSKRIALLGMLMLHQNILRFNYFGGDGSRVWPLARLQGCRREQEVGWSWLSAGGV